MVVRYTLDQRQITSAPAKPGEFLLPKLGALTVPSRTDRIPKMATVSKRRTGALRRGVFRAEVVEIQSLPATAMRLAWTGHQDWSSIADGWKSGTRAT